MAKREANIRQLDVAAVENDHYNDQVVKFEIQTMQKKHIQGLGENVFIGIHPYNYPLTTLPICDKEWHNQTNIPCWNCEEAFTTVPLAIPLSIEPKMETYHVKGNFCSVPCALRYIYTEYYHSSKYNDIVAMFLNICRTIFEIKFPKGYSLRIPPNPKEVLKKYNPKTGITLEEYRDVDFLVGDTPIYNPPFISSGIVLQANIHRVRRNMLRELANINPTVVPRTTTCPVNPETNAQVCFTSDDAEMMMNNNSSSKNKGNINQSLPHHIMGITEKREIYANVPCDELWDFLATKEPEVVTKQPEKIAKRKRKRKNDDDDD